VLLADSSVHPVPQVGLQADQVTKQTDKIDLHGFTLAHVNSVECKSQQVADAYIEARDSRERSSDTGRHLCRSPVVLHDLTELPEGSELRSVTAVPTEVSGRRALRVELTDTLTLHGKPGVDYVDMPTF
jgi:hypothetical protein